MSGQKLIRIDTETLTCGDTITIHGEKMLVVKVIGFSSSSRHKSPSDGVTPKLMLCRQPTSDQIREARSGNPPKPDAMLKFAKRGGDGYSDVLGEQVMMTANRCLFSPSEMATADTEVLPVTVANKMQLALFSKFSDMVPLSECIQGNDPRRNEAVLACAFGEGLAPAQDLGLGLFLGPDLLAQDPDAAGKDAQNKGTVITEQGARVPLMFDAVFQLGGMKFQALAEHKRHVDAIAPVLHLDTSGFSGVSQFTPDRRHSIGGKISTRHFEFRNLSLTNDSDLADRIYSVMQLVRRKHWITEGIGKLKNEMIAKVVAAQEEVSPHFYAVHEEFRSIEFRNSLKIYFHEVEERVKQRVNHIEAKLAHYYAIYQSLLNKFDQMDRLDREEFAEVKGEQREVQRGSIKKRAAQYMAALLRLDAICSHAKNDFLSRSGCPRVSMKYHFEKRRQDNVSLDFESFKILEQRVFIGLNVDGGLTQRQVESACEMLIERLAAEYHFNPITTRVSYDRRGSPTLQIAFNDLAKLNAASMRTARSPLSAPFNPRMDYSQRKPIVRSRKNVASRLYVVKIEQKRLYDLVDGEDRKRTLKDIFVLAHKHDINVAVTDYVQGIVTKEASGQLTADQAGGILSKVKRRLVELDGSTYPHRKKLGRKLVADLTEQRTSWNRAILLFLKNLKRYSTSGQRSEVDRYIKKILVLVKNRRLFRREFKKEFFDISEKMRGNLVAARSKRTLAVYDELFKTFERRAIPPQLPVMAVSDFLRVIRRASRRTGCSRFFCYRFAEEKQLDAFLENMTTYMSFYRAGDNDAWLVNEFRRQYKTLILSIKKMEPHGRICQMLERNYSLLERQASFEASERSAARAAGSTARMARVKPPATVVEMPVTHYGMR